MKSSTYNTTSNTENKLPDWAAPYFERNVAQAEAAYGTPYQEYGGDRLAAPGADTLGARDMVRDIAGQGIGGLDQASDFVRTGMGTAEDLGNYVPTEMSEFGFDPTRQFDAAEAQRYMSPYQQEVTDRNKQAAFRDFQMMQGGRDAAAVNAGAFGGSRQGVVQGMAEEDLMRNLGDIQARGQQDAFVNAQGMFQGDRAAQFDTARARAGEQARVQTGTAAENQFGAGQGLAALQTGAQLAGGLTDLGQLERQGQIQNAQLMEGVGGAMTAEQQAINDQQYQDYIEQRDWTKNQVGGMTNVLNAQPIAATGTSNTVGTTPGPSPFQQIAGAGLSAVGLYKAFQ